MKSKDTNETEAMKVCYSTCDAHHGSWMSVKLNQSRQVDYNHQPSLLDVRKVKSTESRGFDQQLIACHFSFRCQCIVKPAVH